MSIKEIDFRVLKFPRNLKGLRDRYLKGQVTINDLEKLMELSTRAIGMCDDHSPANKHNLEAVTAYIIVIYGRCFNSKFNLPPPLRGIQDNLPEGAKEEELSASEFHQLLINYRNGHIAHADDFLKKYEVGGCLTHEGQIGVVPLIASRVPLEEKSFYTSIQKISSKLLINSQKRQTKFFNEIVEHIKSGNVTITKEPLAIIPIPSDQTTRNIWNLPERPYAKK